MALFPLALALYTFHSFSGHNPLYYESKVTRLQKIDSSSMLYYESEYPFALASDLDTKSRNPDKFEWKSYLKRGSIVRASTHPETFTVRWDKALDRTLISDISRKNRSMELSELVSYNHLLLGMCDYTGIVYKIKKEEGKVFQRHLIADGNGEETKPFKIEWATVKDGLLYVGSFGLEWIEKGEIKHRNPEWVKTISPDGTIENFDWHPVYLAMRSATNTTFPGYLWQEAVHWDPRMRKWLFLPRKATNGIMYDPVSDERKGTDLIILANEDFTDIDVKRFKATASTSRDARHALYESPEYGFTSVRKLPGSDGLFVATKVREIGDNTHTVMCVFDLDGNILSSPRWIEVGDDKYEGLEFV
jgi:soluble calcium-activated nucleotidase 1